MSTKTSLNIDNRKLGMWLVIVSECFLFASLIATYVAFRNESGDGPTAGEILDIPITTISSFVLLMSSFCVVMGFNALEHGDQARFRRWTLLTALGGLIFLGFQAYEFTHFAQQGLGLTTSVFATSFYMLTGTHGAHVAVGVLWLLSVVFRSWQGKFTEDVVVKADIMALYWHFVDVVWIIIFALVYLFVFI